MKGIFHKHGFDKDIISIRLIYLGVVRFPCKPYEDKAYIIIKINGGFS